MGAVPSLPGVEGAPWIGIELDEPFGRNDGSVPGAGKGEGDGRTRYFDCKEGFGLFVRPERVIVGDFPEMGLQGHDDDDDDDDMEEI